MYQTGYRDIETNSASLAVQPCLFSVENDGLFFRNNDHVRSNRILLRQALLAVQQFVFYVESDGPFSENTTVLDNIYIYIYIYVCVSVYNL